MYRVEVDTAVVGNGRDDETLLSKDGRTVSDSLGLLLGVETEVDLLRTVAPDTEDKSVRPSEAVAARA